MSEFRWAAAAAIITSIFPAMAAAPEDRLRAVPPDLRPRIERSLALAGENRRELLAALDAAPAEDRDRMAFLVAQTGYRSFWASPAERTADAAAVTAGLLLAHLKLAGEARRTFPWAEGLDEDTFRRFVLPYRMTTERLADWRTALWSHPDLRPLVDGFAARYRAARGPAERGRVFREMVHDLNTGWVGKRVPYAPRGMPDLNPLEAIANRTGRCTDQTGALVAILRTFGIAATGVRSVAWPDTNDNHNWTAVRDPVTGEWLDVDSGQGGSADDPAYFRAFVRHPVKNAAKIYWVVPGEEEGEVRRSLALAGDEVWPPAIEKYLVAKPVVDRTERYADVAPLELPAPPGALVWLAVWNSGTWEPVAGARASPAGVVRFEKVGCGVCLRLIAWKREGTAPLSDALVVRPDGRIEKRVDPAVAGADGTRKSPKLIWSDEFDGTSLDLTKWDHRQLGPRRDAVNVKEAVSLDGHGHLAITTTKVGDTYRTGMIGTQGKFERAFGYFECRVKFQSEEGHWSAFWLQSPLKAPRAFDPAKDGAEIDIFEYVPRRGDKLQHALHWIVGGPKVRTARHVHEGPGLRDGWHTVGLEWTEAGYAAYVDGKETWRVTEGVSRIPQYIILSLEVGKWEGDIARAKLPDSVLFDYVRVYESRPQQ